MGASVPLVAFSSLCCARLFCDRAYQVLETYTRQRVGKKRAAAEVAAAENFVLSGDGA